MEGLIEEGKGSVLTVLTLGDGDFTFSLDLARYLQGNRSNQFKLIATGIDTLRELTAKYKDSPRILYRLQNCGSQAQKVDDDWKPLQVTVFHGINAVDSTEVGAHEQFQRVRADVVIFNHPHLGVEDAQLHRLFLCHLFHAVDRRWLNHQSGVFHLTLVQGQFERWSCDAAARRHGLALVSETPFAAPALENPSYELRRHQSGKSFKKRRSGGRSVIYTFMRAITCSTDSDSACFSRARGMRPFWISGDPFERTSPKTFLCSRCDKTFREERSLRNHIVSMHPDPDGRSKDKKKKAMDDATRGLTCQLCFELGFERAFACSQALEDHVLAKHSALHKTIPADWSCRNSWSSECPERSHELPSQSEEQSLHGSCDVCGFAFQSRDGHLEHQRMFLPAKLLQHDAGASAALGEGATTTYTCTFCSQAFRERRAQLQHENRCSLASSPPSSRC